MEYRIDINDTWGRRVAIFEDIPVLEATSSLVDGVTHIRGILPQSENPIGHGYTIEVFLDGASFVTANVTQVNPIQSDTKRLILERYVHFHEMVTFEAEWTPDEANRRVKSAHNDEVISDVVKKSINRTLGPIHYGIEHAGYPDGATREYNKLLARKTAENELEVGGISTGQWVSGARIDISNAYAKDGDTIAGLRVDGVDWPDLRLMMIDAEESSINSHAISLHPEVAEWSAGQYDLSHYKFLADQATLTLQGFIDANGIDLIELNPHRGSDGSFDDRVDAYGRYLGMVYGGSQCYNAAMVEQGLAHVLLYDDGRGHVPEMELKDFYSYAKTQSDTVEDTVAEVSRVDANINIFEWLNTLAYAAGGYGWSIDQEFCVSFRRLDTIDTVVFQDIVQHSVDWETQSGDLVNQIEFVGNESADGHTESYSRDDSVLAYGERHGHLSLHAIIDEADADAIVDALLDDVAYPAPEGSITIYHGNTNVCPGDLIEVRRSPLDRVTEEVEGEWGERFTERLVARVRSVTQIIEGRHLQTVVALTSPLRTLRRPSTALERSQGTDSSQFEFRLDDTGAGLDAAYHLD